MLRQNAGCRATHSPQKYPQITQMDFSVWICVYLCGSVGSLGWEDYPASTPPSTGMTAPVIQDEALESRKTIIAATSSG